MQDFETLAGNWINDWMPGHKACTKSLVKLLQQAAEQAWEWQPIETAPPGKKVYIYYDEEAMVISCRGDDRGCQHGKEIVRRMTIGDKLWKSNLFRIPERDKKGDRIQVKALGWMPLPSPPKAGA